MFIISIPARADQPPASQPILLQGKMVCVGASITAGEGVKSAECYVGLLQARADADHLNLKVIGQGRSGWSTGAYLANKDKIAKAMPEDAALITILLGTNDCREDGSPGDVGKRAADCLDQLINVYHQRVPNAQIVIIGPTKIYPAILTKRLLDAHYGDKSPANLKQISEGFAAVAKKRGLLFIYLGELPSSPKDSIDGVHPNAAGHQEISEVIWKALHPAEPATRPVPVQPR